jgi:hypothetical protein
MLKKNRHSVLLDQQKSIGFISIPEELLLGLLRYLNDARAPIDKDIVAILDRLLDLERIGPNEIGEPLNELNRDLRRYQFRPWLSPHYDADWHTIRWGVIWYSGHPGRDPMQMGEALDTIFDLARAGQLNRLRRCARCRIWLYAKSRHQNYCSTKCQQKQFTQSDRFKEHRRAYMRDRYRRLFPKTSKARRRRLRR